MRKLLKRLYDKLLRRILIFLAVILAFVLAWGLKKISSDKANSMSMFDNTQNTLQIPKLKLDVLEVEGHATRISEDRVDNVPFVGIYYVDLSKSKIDTNGDKVSVQLPEICYEVFIKEQNAINLKESEQKSFLTSAKNILRTWFGRSKTQKGINIAKNADEEFKNNVTERLNNQVYFESASQQAISMVSRLLKALNNGTDNFDVSFTKNAGKKNEK